MTKIFRKMHPYMFIILSFFSVILIGTILLVMPFASKTGKSFGFVDSLFMSTSAVCVTGLSVMETSLGADMTVYAKIVMAILMEIGGLSIITIGVFFFNIIGAKIGVSRGYLLRESLNQDTMKNILSLVKNIMIISFSIQLVCALLNWYPFFEFLENSFPDQSHNISRALGISLFHSSAAFNNAGFDILEYHGNMYSLIGFSTDSGVVSNFSIYMVNYTTMFMIFTGGIGFVVIQDVIQNKRWKYYSLHTKITLIMTAALIFVGTMIIYFTDEKVSFTDALFTAITSRTAGFDTYNMSLLKDNPPAFITIISLMFIGASPCSTGGGVKTTTFAIILIAIYHFARGQKTKAFKKTIDNNQIIKAFVLVALSVMLVIVATFFILITQPEFGTDRVLFEVISAFSTTGLSMGITNMLNIGSKFVIIFLMIFGRLGILTVIGVLNKNWIHKDFDEIRYVEESVIIG